MSQSSLEIHAKTNQKQTFLILFETFPGAHDESVVMIPFLPTLATHAAEQAAFSRGFSAKNRVKIKEKKKNLQHAKRT